MKEEISFAHYIIYEQFNFLKIETNTDFFQQGTFDLI